MIETVTNFLTTAPLWMLITIGIGIVIAAGWVSGMFSQVKSFWKRIIAPALMVAVIIAGIIGVVRYPDIATQVAWVAGGVIVLIIVFKIIGGVSRSRKDSGRSASPGRNDNFSDFKNSQKPSKSTGSDSSQRRRNDGDDQYKGVTF